MIDIATLQALNAPTREERLENLQKAVQTASWTCSIFSVFTKPQ